MKCRAQPCETCPYRRDVPSGVWSAEEYAKLPDYDKPTSAQPPQVFHCHTSPDFICTGWAIVHGERAKRGHELLSLRLADILRGEILEIPAPSVPLFSSGRAAAEHGMRDLYKPGRAAGRAIRKVAASRARRSRK